MDVYNIERQNNSFDFLRNFAALSITFAHSFSYTYPKYIEPLFYFTSGKISFADIGLCIFFSISGYLITKSLLHSTSIKNYIWKRILRIQPLLIVLCILTIFFLGFFFTTLPLNVYFSDINTWTYFRNIFPLTGLQFYLPGIFGNYIGEQGVNASLWTLIIEERLYFLLAVISLVSKKIIFPLYLFAAVFNVCYFINNNFGTEILPFFKGISGYYAVIFLNAGVMYSLQAFNSNKVTRTIVISLIIFFASLISPSFVFLQVLAIPMFIIGIAHVKCFLNGTVLRGDYTYGIYVFSFPVQQMLVSENFFHDNPYLLFFAVLIIVIPAAIISWHFLEKKSLEFRSLYK